MIWQGSAIEPRIVIHLQHKKLCLERGTKPEQTAFPEWNNYCQGYEECLFLDTAGAAEDILPQQCLSAQYSVIALTALCAEETVLATANSHKQKSGPATPLKLSTWVLKATQMTLCRTEWEWSCSLPGTAV